jgi:hypothetical protein
MGSWVWWFRPIILALQRLRQEDSEFDIILGYTERPYLETKTKVKNKTKLLIKLN